MKGRLYRSTPAGGKPEHFTHDFRSACLLLDEASRDWLAALPVGDRVVTPEGDTWERVA